MSIKDLLKYQVTHKSDKSKNELPEHKAALANTDNYALSDYKYKKSKELEK